MRGFHTITLTTNTLYKHTKHKKHKSQSTKHKAQSIQHKAGDFIERGWQGHCKHKAPGQSAWQWSWPCAG
jgi:hypothetical protein